MKRKIILEVAALKKQFNVKGPVEPGTFINLANAQKETKQEPKADVEKVSIMGLV